ncbi:MAG: LolA family protein [Ignavibacteria bacterium]
MTNKKFSIEILSFIILIFQVIFSQTNPQRNFDPDKFLKEVQNNYKNFQNFVVEFTREVSSPVISDKQISNGKLFYLSQNKYRLEIDEQTIISDGETVYNYSKRAKRVVITKFEKNFYSPQNLLTNIPENLKKEFSGEEYFENKIVYKFRFYPSSTLLDFKTLIVWISTDKIIQKIQVEDWAGNVHIITNKKFSPNQLIKEDLIKFKIPAGVKVVDLR